MDLLFLFKICHLQPGEYFGEISLVFKNQRRTADVQALEYCCIYRLDRKTFQTNIAIHEDILKSMRNTAADRMAATERLNAIHLQLINELQQAKTFNFDEY